MIPALANHLCLPEEIEPVISRKAKKRIHIGALSGLFMMALPLAATEHRGVVKFGDVRMSGVTVTISQAEKRLTTTSDDEGTYFFPNLTDGLWNIRVEMQCFETIEREIAVSPESPPAQWDLKLQSFDAIKAAAPTTTPDQAKPAAIAAANTPVASNLPEQASVAAVAVAPPASNAKGKKGVPPPTTAQTGFQRSQLNASPGASTNAPAETALSGDYANKAPSEGMLINGSVNNGASSPFAQSPAFGNNRRGLRSLYNGNFGVVLANSALDAAYYSLTGQPTPKPNSNQITTMGSFGGPIRIPHLVMKYYPSFTVNYQYANNRNGNTQSSLMPTAAERAGDFSGFSNIIYDPASRAPFPANIIPTNRISPQALALMSYYPLPNFTGVGGASPLNYEAPLVPRSSSGAMQARINKTLTPRWTANGLFAFQDSNGDTPNVFSFVDGSHSLGLNSQFQISRRIGTRMFLNMSGAFSRQSTIATPYFANRANVSGSAGITGNDQSPLYWGPPALGFASGIQGLSDSNYSATHNQTKSASMNMSWSHSPHSFRWGADLRRQDFNAISESNPRGSFGFTGLTTQAPSVSGVPVAGTGSDFADFLLGIPDSSSIAFGNADKYMRNWVTDLFINDDWHVRPSLTVTATMRWDYGSPTVEKYGRLVELNVAPGFTSASPVCASTVELPPGSTCESASSVGLPNSLIRPDKHEFEPQVGVAWRPLPASSLVIRAGYGLAYNTSNYAGYAGLLAQQSPFSKSLSVTNSAADPLTLANGFNASPNVTTDLYAFDPNYRVGYAQAWNVQINRDLPGALVMQLQYQGIKGTRAQQTFLPNTYPDGAFNPCPQCPVGFYYITSNGNSTREQAQVQLRRRLRSGFTATATYTFSKSIDDASLLGGGGSVGSAAQNWLNLAGERGLSAFDQRHNFGAQLQYSTGVGVAGGTLLGGWRGLIVKDWTFLTNITVGSGLPLTPSCSGCIISTTGITGPVRPEYVGGDIYSTVPGRFLNWNAYIAPLPGEWGDAGRDSITGPGQFSMAASMARTFRLTERYNLDMRFDSTNVLNHVVFGGWNAAFVPSGTGQFGIAQAPNQMRVVKVTARFRF